MNIMYNKPIVENSLIHPSEAREFSPMIPSPFGPIMIPERINPMIPGILKRLSRIGDNNIMRSKRENTNTGLSSGSLNSENKCSRK